MFNFKTTGSHCVTMNNGVGYKYQNYSQKGTILRIKPSKTFDGLIRRTDHRFGGKRVLLSGNMSGYGFEVQGSSYRLAKVAAKKMTRFV